MPFGLANSPSVYQSFVNDIFRDMLDHWVVLYIDDILIYSNSFDEHIYIILFVPMFKSKAEKWEFHQTKISFLGYVISQARVAMDDNKVRAVVYFPQPHTVKELQSFLDFANFYWRFIKNFSSVAAPLTSMTRQNDSLLTWSPEALQAFQELKTRFTSVSILHHPDPNLAFIVEVDASSAGFGAILSQRHGSPAKMFPCAFFSRKLSSSERNYDVGNRELLAMKAAMEEWRHWLEG